MTQTLPTPKRLAIVGGGPAGLMAAEIARAAGLAVDHETGLVQHGQML